MNMRKRTRIFAVLLISLLMLQGCGIIRGLNLPKDPKVYEEGSINDNSGRAYTTLEYEGKTYVAYAEFTDFYAQKVDEVVGYVNTGLEVPNIYVCTLRGLSLDEYFMTINAMTHGVPTIYREISVSGELEYDNVRPFGYDIWEKQ